MEGPDDGGETTMARIYIGKVKATGERYYYETKVAWNRRYFRCDLSDDAEWHALQPAPGSVPHARASGILRHR